jgi:TolB-like protein/class 3 adenylate cyclase/Tfp pilus assembly protein PilF
VLFIDIVGYSKLLINQQSQQLDTLKQIVRGTEQFRAAEAEGKLLRLPTGDGGALVFRNSQEAPVLCALEIGRELKNHPELKVRMGIHSGPVNAITDLNEQANIAGAGINYAQRVMDCGDAGHILLSKHVAEDLEHYPRWQPHLHDLGQTAVKHGVIVSAVNLCTDDAGNPDVPERFRNTITAPATATPTKSSVLCLRNWIIGILIGTAIVYGALTFLKHRRENGHTASNNNPNETAAVALSIPEKSIAVLPFENLSDDKSNAYFAEGIQDEILTRLAKIAALKVISRTSTQKYKSAPDNLREVGQQLGVAHLLEGSVQKAGNAVHINVQLIKAATDAHLWAESYDRELQNIFGVEGEVAGKIADALDAKLTGAEEKALAVRPTGNVEAYDAYLHGRSIEATTYDLHGESLVGSDYSRAVKLDPSFALAWARLASVRSFLYFNTYDPATNSAAAVKEAVDRAMALQPELGEAWIARGDYRYMVLHDYPGALEAFVEAGKRVPNSADVFGETAFVERRMGRWDAAVSHFRKAILLDPRNLQLHIYAAQTFGYLRKFDEAGDFVDRALQISPDTVGALSTKLTILQAAGRLDEASKLAARMSVPEGREPLEVIRATQLLYERRFDAAIAQLSKALSKPWAHHELELAALPLLGYCQQLAGKPADARATYAKAVQEIKPTPASIVPVDVSFLPCALALSYAGLGEKDKALAEARQAVTDYQDDAINKPTAEIALAQVEAQVGDIDAAIVALPHLLEVPAGLTPALLRIDPYGDPLRKDPRFQKLCQEPQ